MSASQLVIALLGRFASMLVLFVTPPAARIWSTKDQAWRLLRLQSVVDDGDDQGLNRNSIFWGI
jgi:hypothetical protein